MADQRDAPENFWTVGTTAMTEREAERAAACIESEFPDVHAFASDPRYHHVVGLDRWTAEMLRDALTLLVRAGGDVGTLLEDLEAWLLVARPYETDEDRYEPVVSS